MGEAIETTQALYPKLLDAKPDLLFMLKCRQFVEMVNGTDSEVRGGNISTLNNVHSGHTRSPKSYYSSDGSNRSSPAHSPHPYTRSGTPPSSQHQYSVHFSQQASQQQMHHHRTSAAPECNSPSRSSGKNASSHPHQYSQQQHHHHNSSYNNSSDAGMQNNHPYNYSRIGEEEALLNSNNAMTGGDHITLNGGLGGSRLIDNEEMDLSDEDEHSNIHTNGNHHVNGNSVHDDDEEMGMLLFFLVLFCTLLGTFLLCSHRKGLQSNTCKTI